MKTFTTNQKKGQSTLFMVSMFSIIMVTTAYYIYDRNLDTTKAISETADRSQAIQALENVAQELALAYTSKACDPGLLFSNPLFQTQTVLLNGPTIPPGQSSSILTFRGKMVGFDSATQGRLFSAPAEYTAAKKYYQVFIQRMWTLENTIISQSNPTDHTMIYPPSGTLLSVVAMEKSKSPALGTNFSISGSGAAPIGSRDVAIELATIFPPLSQISAAQFLIPRHRISVIVVLHNSCSKGSGLSAKTPYLGTFDTNGADEGGCLKGIRSPFSNGGGRCFNDCGRAELGGDMLTPAINARSLEMYTRFVEEGYFESSFKPQLGTSFTVTAQEFANCSDINRDGVANKTDIDLLQKFLLGYLYTTAPIWPGFHNEQDPNHKIQ